ncbi:DUF6035 family protein [Thalassotalea sp. PP2-459]|uniref:DUF6035 family protein n=1 Tax=Thalassotalea sp. PP2-459 TaxID=1742724 RepID=UPI0020C9FC01|nr:DUF6035 family protein [Thalassotalea sp. PP2-459]
MAFELQVSTTFIDVIVERERFYRENGAFIIWVFLNFEEKRFTELDIFYANKLNAFILDEEAKLASSKSGELVLKCHYKDYFVQESGELVEVAEKDEEELVPVSQLSFDDVTGKLFFFDSNNRKRNVERQAETRRTEIRIEKERRAAEERARKAREAKANRQILYGNSAWQPTYCEPERTENKGLSDANFKALTKSRQYESLKCDNCGNTSRFYDRACFIFCSKCRKEVKY